MQTGPKREPGAGARFPHPQRGAGAGWLPVGVGESRLSRAVPAPGSTDFAPLPPAGLRSAVLGPASVPGYLGCLSAGAACPHLVPLHPAPFRWPRPGEAPRALAHRYGNVFLPNPRTNHPLCTGCTFNLDLISFVFRQN